jgi:hypothetical protein
MARAKVARAGSRVRAKSQCNFALELASGNFAFTEVEVLTLSRWVAFIS